jgi:FkbM family methyltransferase
MERPMILIKPRNLLHNFAMWVWKQIPDPLRRFLKKMEVGERLRLLGLRYEKLGIWYLNGVLKGFQFCIENEDQYQFIDHPYEPDVCNAIEKMIKPGWICADVGAHIGFITLVISKMVGSDGKIFAFEAVPDNAKLLQKNIELNNLSKRVVVENLAVTDGNLKFVHISHSRTSFESKISENVPESSSKTIRASSLDSYFLDNKLDFIKMDIEGGEVLAIKGMKRLLAIAQPILLLEIHENGRPAIDDLISAGYSFYDLNFQLISDAGIVYQNRHCVACPKSKSLLSVLKMF